MGASASVQAPPFETVEDALAAGITQDDIDAWYASQGGGCGSAPMTLTDVLLKEPGIICSIVKMMSVPQTLRFLATCTELHAMKEDVFRNYEVPAVLDFRQTYGIWKKSSHYGFYHAMVKGPKSRWQEWFDTSGVEGLTCGSSITTDKELLIMFGALSQEMEEELRRRELGFNAKNPWSQEKEDELRRKQEEELMRQEEELMRQKRIEKEGNLFWSQMADSWLTRRFEVASVPVMRRGGGGKRCSKLRASNIQTLRRKKLRKKKVRSQEMEEEPRRRELGFNAKNPWSQEKGGELRRKQEKEKRPMSKASRSSGDESGGASFGQAIPSSPSFGQQGATAVMEPVMRRGGERKRFPKLRALNISCGHDITDLSVLEVVGRCPNLQSLVLYMCNITDASVLEVARRYPNLQSLDLTHSRNITDASLIELGRRCPNLQTLKLKYNAQFRIRDAGVLELAAGCPNLQTLHLSSTSTTGVGLSEVARRCSNLQSLELAGCYDMTDAGVLEVGRRCSNLQSLNLDCCSGVTDVAVSEVARGCPNLQSLNLRGARLTDASVTEVARGCPNLQYLNLNECYDITDVSLLELGRGCPNLQIIKCKDSKRITTTGVLELRRGCPNLQNHGVPYAADSVEFTNLSSV